MQRAFISPLDLKIFTATGSEADRYELYLKKYNLFWRFFLKTIANGRNIVYTANVVTLIA